MRSIFSVWRIAFSVYNGACFSYPLYATRSKGAQLCIDFSLKEKNQAGAKRWFSPGARRGAGTKPA